MEIPPQLRTTGLHLLSLLTLLPANPFLLHVLLEIPASLSFFFYPSNQLQIYSSHAHAVIRQYAVLLLSSVLIALAFALRHPSDHELDGQVAGALAVYHLAPMARAIARLGDSDWTWQSPLFLTAHGLCFTGLTMSCWDLYLGALL